MNQQKSKAGLFWDRLYIGTKMRAPAMRKARYAKKRIKMINGGYNGSRSEFRSVVVPFWKKYGIRPKKFWYDLYCAGSDHYDPRFIPDDLWYHDICPYFCKQIGYSGFQHKGLLDRVVPNVRKPETVIKRVFGQFYDSENHLLCKDEAVALCLKEEGKLVIKPASRSSGGKNVQVFEAKEKTEADYRQMLDQYGDHMVLQRFIRQHKDLAAIHAGSINTIRVMTFFFQDQVHVLSAQLRMGAGDANVDNISSGGVACPIKEDGWLMEKAVTRKSEWSDHHPSGIKFKDIRVPNYDRVVAKAKELASTLPFLRIIGWDFAIAEDGEPMLIEFNTPCEQNQIGGRAPNFGELTEAVLEEVLDKKRLNK